jgi:hypothetical protein
MAEPNTARRAVRRGGSAHRFLLRLSSRVFRSCKVSGPDFGTASSAADHPQRRHCEQESAEAERERVGAMLTALSEHAGRKGHAHAEPWAWHPTLRIPVGILCVRFVPSCLCGEPPRPIVIGVRWSLRARVLQLPACSPLGEFPVFFPSFDVSGPDFGSVSGASHTASAAASGPNSARISAAISGSESFTHVA